MNLFLKYVAAVVVAFIVAPSLYGCTDNNPKGDDGGDGGEPPVVESRENGYWIPYLKTKPVQYWNVTDLMYRGDKNSLDPESPDSGLRNHLLFQSMAGLAHRAIAKGANNTGLWMYSPDETSGYLHSHNALRQMGLTALGEITARELALMSDGNGAVRGLFDGYVLTDLENNQESASVAAVASHVYNAIIVDVKDKAVFDAAGYEMLYDAREKTTLDSWREFKDKCKNNALVLMHVQTAELREYAIANELFVLNINRIQNKPELGDNWDLFYEIMMWLEPNSPVLGWDVGIDEGRLAEAISLYGNHSVPYDWGYNTTLTALAYPDRQSFARAKSIDPKQIDYDLDKKFVSYYLSDGDNVQWVMNDFEGLWYDHPMVQQTKTSFGLPVANLAMIAPAQMANLFNKQSADISVFERSSYFFIDQYGAKKDRDAIMMQMAEEQAAHMKKHNVKILGMVTRHYSDGPEAKKGYQMLIDANDELEGIITIEYIPYANSKREVMWFTNKKGIDIPVVHTTWSIWSFEDHNDPDEGSPAYIARKLDVTENKFNIICLHCWSKFRDRGTTANELVELIPDPDGYPYQDPDVIFGSGGAELCSRRLDDRFEVINLQEMIWRIRMEYRPEQTKKLLK